MGRKQSHKKDLKAEKAKVKLKTTKTKFLPKGLNVTDTTFKIKPIVISEQLRERSSDDILSKRKLNIKDLLSRIKHHNENARTAACEELAEMVKIHSEEITQQHLAQVCLAVSTLMQDRESKVRKAAMKSIKTILLFISTEKLAPFLDYFSTNLRCAMTNIDSSIQEDSLNFLDCFITTDCGLIAKSSEKLLPDFLSLISKMRNSSELGRTLTLNLGSKMTIVAWRIKVLSRLHATLNIILTEKSKGNAKSTKGQRMFYVKDKYDFPIYKQSFMDNLERPCIDIFTTSSSIVSLYSDSVNAHIKTLIPLLYETWLEVVPEQKVQKAISESMVLSTEEATLLTCLTNTLYLLWQYVKKTDNDDINLNDVFMTKEGQKFLNHLLKNFPYCHTGEVVKKNKNNHILEHNNDRRCVHENLLICLIYLALNVNNSQRNKIKEIAVINTYLTKIFRQRYTVKVESINCIIELLSESFGINWKLWSKSGVDLNRLLENAVVLYNQGKFSNKQTKIQLLKVLADIVENDQLNKNPLYQNWLSNLPLLLSEPSISNRTIQVLMDLSKKNCEKFLVGLLDNLTKILETLDCINITSESEPINIDNERRNIASIFYYVRSYCGEDLDAFRSFIYKSQTSFRDYFQQVLSLMHDFH